MPNKHLGTEYSKLKKVYVVLLTDSIMVLTEFIAPIMSDADVSFVICVSSPVIKESSSSLVPSTP